MDEQKAKPLEKDEQKERLLKEQQLSTERQREGRGWQGMPEKEEPRKVTPESPERKGMPENVEPRNIPKVPKEPEPMPSRTEPGKGKEKREESEEGT